MYECVLFTNYNTIMDVTYCPCPNLSWSWLIKLGSCASIKALQSDICFVWNLVHRASLDSFRIYWTLLHETKTDLCNMLKNWIQEEACFLKYIYFFLTFVVSAYIAFWFGPFITTSLTQYGSFIIWPLTPMYRKKTHQWMCDMLCSPEIWCLRVIV